MKKTVKAITILALALTLVLSSLSLSSCGDKSSEGKLKILCTVFPLYDWTRSVVGDAEGVEVSLLVKNGADLHSYQPSFADIAAIKDSDVVIYVGGASDKWVEEAIDGDTVALKLSAIKDITLHGVSADSHHHDHSDVIDEHIWLSLGNATVATKAIRDTLCSLDKENADIYDKWSATYLKQLDGFDRRMLSLSEHITEPLIFADRFPFVYLLEEYGIEYFAAFEGCTTDTNADFDTVIDLANKVSASKNKYLFTTEAPDTELVDSIIRQSGKTDVKVISLNSMQSVAEADLNSVSYASIMNSNITVLEDNFITSKD